MSAPSHSQLLALKAVCDAIIEAVSAAGNAGAPGGVLYAALMGQGCTFENFNGIMSGLVGAGMLCRVGECYYLGEFTIERGAAK